MLPQAVIDENVAILPGLDGRKMSKSYDNVIPLFAPRDVLRRQIAAIVTDSRAPGEAKTTEGSALFQIYQAFASAEETAALRKAYADGIAWGDAKQWLFERIDREIGPMRARYDELMARPDRVEDMLQAGAGKARKLSAPFMRELRHAVGLRVLGSTGALSSHPSAVRPGARTSAAAFKQYREADGQFRFKVADTAGQVLLTSKAFVSPKDAGAMLSALKAAPDEAACTRLAEEAVGEPLEATDAHALWQAIEAAAKVLGEKAASAKDNT